MSEDKLMLCRIGTCGNIENVAETHFLYHGGIHLCLLPVDLKSLRIIVLSQF
jgi:hypothetical protein